MEGGSNLFLRLGMRQLFDRLDELFLGQRLGRGLFPEIGFNRFDKVDLL